MSAAILRAGGESILIDAAKKVPATLGDVVVTAAGLLPAKHVFHAITIANGGLPPTDIVANATKRCLELLDNLRLTSIAFPAIGAGAAGFRYEDVAAHMVEVIVDFLAKSSRNIDVTLYLFDRFGRMQAVDFIGFFEQLAVRTNGMQAVRAASQSPRERHGPRVRRKPTIQEKRKALVQELGQLEGERQKLEASLAADSGALTRLETRRIDERLRDVHEKRLKVLSAVKQSRSSQLAVSVFVSYSHADEQLRKELGKHLSVLERQGLISTWHDRMIGAGSEWEGMIDDRLEQARVILLLVSSDFVNSRYCYDVEMTRALERHEKREALVIPIVLRPVVFKGLPFAKIQALPRDAKPATAWPNIDSAFVEVTEGLREALEGIKVQNAQLGITGPVPPAAAVRRKAIRQRRK